MDYRCSNRQGRWTKLTTYTKIEHPFYGPRCRPITDPYSNYLARIKLIAKGKDLLGIDAPANAWQQRNRLYRRLAYIYALEIW